MRFNFYNEWDERYIETAFNLAEGSKCAAKKVGCIIVKDGNIIASGVNGTPPKYLNCKDIFLKRDGKWYSSYAGTVQTENGEFYKKENFIEENNIKYYEITDEEKELTHKKFSDRYEIHAEINAISKMAKLGISTKDTSLYCTHSPCIHCAKSIIAAGIKEVYYTVEFDDIDVVESFLNNNYVSIYQIILDEEEVACE